MSKVRGPEQKIDFETLLPLPLQDGRACDLTEAGQTEFPRMLVAGLGMQLNKKIREVKVA